MNEHPSGIGRDIEEYQDILRAAERILPPELSPYIHGLRPWWREYQGNPYYMYFPHSLGYAIGGIVFRAGEAMDSFVDDPAVMHATTPDTLEKAMYGASLRCPLTDVRITFSEIQQLIASYQRNMWDRTYRERIQAQVDALPDAIEAIISQYRMRGTRYTYAQAFEVKERSIMPVVRLSYVLSEGQEHDANRFARVLLDREGGLLQDDIIDVEEDRTTGCVNTVIGIEHDLMATGVPDRLAAEQALAIAQNRLAVYTRELFPTNPIRAFVSRLLPRRKTRNS